MQTLWMRASRMLGWNALAGTAIILLAGCARFDQSWIPGSAAALAKNQIMLVRKDPPSFGFQRLLTRSELYPDLLWFVKQRGIPDFMAETGDEDWKYFVLYYLKPRQAFACRSHRSHAAAIEFSGPYPITDGEFAMLEGFRRGKVR